MRRALLLASTAGLVLAAPAGSSPPAERPSPLDSERGQYVPGEVIVGFRAGTSAAAVARVHARVPARVAERFGAFRMELVKLSRGVSIQAAIRRYSADSAVAFAEPNYLLHPDADPPDALFPDLWGLNNTGQLHPVADADLDGVAADSAGSADADIDAPEAWGVEMGDGAVVAVIDTGVDVGHSDLAGQLWVNVTEAAGTPNFDDDGNGYEDDVNGWDFPENDNTLLDTAPHFFAFDHGTHVAGTIAGGSSATGIIGVCPGCKIMVLKVARDSDGQIDTGSLLAALAYAEANGAKIANMSLGGPFWENSLREAIRTSGLLVVAAAGNDALDNDMFLEADVVGDSNPDIFSPAYPASYTLSNILTVGASNDMDENAYATECFVLILSKAECAFTNWGHDSVDVSAPGADIESSVPGGGWETWNGTSMAAPHVSGIAGLLLSQNPALSVGQLKNAIMRSVNKPDSLKKIFIPSYVEPPSARTKSGSFTRTTGRVNAFKALTAGTSNATPLTDGNVNGAKGMSKASVSGSVAWPADINDVRKKKLSKGHVYRVTLAVPAHKDYDLFVWKPGTKEIWQLTKSQGASRRVGSGDELVQFVAGSTGVYYFQVSAWLFKSGNYTLTVKRLA